MSGKKDPRTRDPQYIACRFWRNVIMGGQEECWEWQARTNAAGYGVFRVVSNTELAHRFSWQLVFGPIPDGLCCLHRCDNPRCVNPSHLFLGTRGENNKDRAEKGRTRSGPQAGEDNNHAKLTRTDIIEIRKSYESGRSQGEIAELHGTTQSTISRIVRNKAWTCIL